MYDDLIQQAQAKQEQFWAEIEQARLISEAKKAQQISISLEALRQIYTYQDDPTCF
jgi:hypothetical protein